MPPEGYVFAETVLLGLMMGKISLKEAEEMRKQMDWYEAARFDRELPFLLFFAKKLIDQDKKP